MSEPVLNQSQAEAHFQNLQLGFRYLTAALESRGQAVEAPKLSGDIFQNIAALETHCAALESKLSALPAVGTTDAGSIAALTKERDEWKAKAESAAAEIAGLKTEIGTMSEKYSRELAAKIVEHGISMPGRSALAAANAQGRKPTATEKLFSAKGVNSLEQLATTPSKPTH